MGKAFKISSKGEKGIHELLKSDTNGKMVASASISDYVIIISIIIIITRPLSRSRKSLAGRQIHEIKECDWPNKHILSYVAFKASPKYGGNFP